MLLTRGMGSKPWLRDCYRFGCRNWTPVFIDSGSKCNNFATDSVSSNKHSLDEDIFIGLFMTILSGQHGLITKY